MNYNCKRTNMFVTKDNSKYYQSLHNLKGTTIFDQITMPCAQLFQNSMPSFKNSVDPNLLFFIHTMNLYQPLSHHYFCPVNVVCYLYLSHIFHVHFRLVFFMEANNMNPDQDAPKQSWKQSDLGQYCLQYTTVGYIHCKNISR